MNKLDLVSCARRERFLLQVISSQARIDFLRRNVKELGKINAVTELYESAFARQNWATRDDCEAAIDLILS